MELRTMVPGDYDKVYALWKSIKGFGIRRVDDSRDSIEAFLKRNPTTSVVAIEGDEIIGTILCGYDGRYGYMYHVCVKEPNRRHGIGKQMVVFCMRALKELNINKIALIAFRSNDAGNAFWHQIGWKSREDLNYYDFTLNDANIIAFNE